MARLMGRMPSTEGEQFVYDFAMKSLPDYIYVTFAAALDTPRGKLECDALLLVPHLGVIAMEIRSGKMISRKDGRWQIHDRNGAVRAWNPKLNLERYHFAILSYLKEKFEVSPFVYDILALPYCSEMNMHQYCSADDPCPDQFFFWEDFADGDRFLLKLHQSCMRRKILISEEAREKYLLCDLTDIMAHNIFCFWETGMKMPERPTRPPFVFLSYNQNNSLVAKEIKEQLEKRGIFVWRAPEDVPLGKYYLPTEMSAIGQCDAFLILLSRPAQESDEVRKEFDKARELGKTILPIKVENCELTEYYQDALREYQYSLMVKPDAALMEEIVRRVMEASVSAG